jgi:hypothetical protein
MAPPQTPRRKPETAPPRAKPAQRFQHTPVEVDEGDEAPRFGRGSGCIPVFLFRFSLLTMLIWLACLVIAAGIARLTTQEHRSAAARDSAMRRTPSLSDR